MTELPTALIDSNVIIDITGRDRTWQEWSATALSRCQSALTNPIVYSELCYFKRSPTQVDALLTQLDITYREITKDALYLAAQAYRLNRTRGGNKTSPLPDFFIGAHALVMGIPIITRDVSRYQSYFATLQLIAPASQQD